MINHSNLGTSNFNKMGQLLKYASASLIVIKARTTHQAVLYFISIPLFAQTVRKSCKQNSKACLMKIVNMRFKPLAMQIKCYRTLMQFELR